MAKVFLHDQTCGASSSDGIGTLTVNCLSGSVVTVKSGKTEYTATAGDSGTVMFNGLNHGTWDVTVDTNGAIYTESVDIVADYEITVERTLYKGTIRYPAGCDFYITDGSKYYAPDNSGIWNYESYKKLGDSYMYVVNGPLEAASGQFILNKNSTTEIGSYDYITSYYEYDLTSRIYAYVYVTLPDSVDKWITYTRPNGSTASMAKQPFHLNALGTWTISCVIDGQTVSKTVEVTDPLQACSVSFDDYVATVSVTYPAGTTCTCTDGNNTYTAPDNSGKWYFFAPNIGSWTFTAIASGRSESTTVAIESKGQHEDVAIKFFNATINATYPIGATCYCSDGYTTISASDTKGSWTFNVPRKGAWTITAYNNDQRVSSTVNIISDGQNANVTIKFFEATIKIYYPSGASCSCTDGTKTYYAPDSNGYWTLTVPRIGEWVIKSASGNRNVADSVNITYDGQIVTKTLQFFESYIDVTYPSGSYKVVLNSVNSYGTKKEYAVDTSKSGSHRFVVFDPGDYEVEVYRVEPYDNIESNAGEYASSAVSITSSNDIVFITLTYNTLPEFTYTGDYIIVNDNDKQIFYPTDGDWNIKLLETGDLTFVKLNGASKGIEVFVCGGGGNGGEAYDVELEYGNGGGGGGGGETMNITVNPYELNINTLYEITVGGAGGRSSAFDVIAYGGQNGDNANNVSVGTGGGNGGNGGRGYNRDFNPTDAADGENGVVPFDGFDTYNYRYGAGGGGGTGFVMYIEESTGEMSNVYANGYAGKGGLSGGGAGGGTSGRSDGLDGSVNSGAGGGGAGFITDRRGEPGVGGSGIVIIRNKR